MTIEDIAKNKMVEEITLNCAKNHSEDPDNIQDLIQDIYIILLEKEKIILPLNYKETKYYIARLARNNVWSKTSRYYYKYKMYDNKRLPLEEWAQPNDNNNTDV